MVVASIDASPRKLYEHQGISIFSMWHAEELLERGAKGFLVTISMVKEDGQQELHDIPVVAEYEDIFEALKRPPRPRADVFLRYRWSQEQHQFHELHTV